MASPLSRRAWTKLRWSISAQNLTTRATPKEISSPLKVFRHLQHRVPSGKSWRLSLDRNASQFGGFSSIRRELSNWRVAWHQDLTIAVRERKTVEGFGPWTTKDGVLHVQPSAEVMNGILAIRLHLDESASDNGPLRVIPGSHREGRLSAERISSWHKQESITCTVPRGGALLMRPLLLHASSACAVPKPRRVIHLEFAAAELPHGLDWHEKCGPNGAPPL